MLLIFEPGRQTIGTGWVSVAATKQVRLYTYWVVFQNSIEYCSYRGVCGIINLISLVIMTRMIMHYFSNHVL